MNCKGILLENKFPYNGVTYGEVYEVYKVQQVDEELFVFYFINDDGLEDYVNYYVNYFTNGTNSVYNNDLFNIYFQV